jgi:hypothetical protein
MSNRTTERTQPVPALTFVLSPADITKDYFVPLAANLASAAPGAYVTMLSQAFVLTEARDVIILGAFAVVPSAAANGSINIEVDGAPVCAGGVNGIAAGGAYEVGSLSWKVSLAAGAHTIAMRWKTYAGTMDCRPVAVPEQEYASLLIRTLGNVEAF